MANKIAKAVAAAVAPAGRTAPQCAKLMELQILKEMMPPSITAATKINNIVEDFDRTNIDLRFFLAVTL